MGSFFLQPADGETYISTWTDEYGNNYTTPLPSANKGGVTLQVQPHAAKSLVVIKRCDPSGDNLHTGFVVAHMNQRVVYKAAVNLTTRNSAIPEIPTDTLPTAVPQGTPFDSNWTAPPEPVGFLNNRRHL